MTSLCRLRFLVLLSCCADAGFATSSVLKDPRHHYPQWFLLIQTSPKYWKRLVCRACTHSVLQRQKHHQVRTLHCNAIDILQRFLPEDLFLHTHTPAVKDHEDAVFGCMQCRLKCRSTAQEDAHAFKKHGRISHLRRLCDHPTCLSCLKHFHTMQKLKAHLHYNARCRSVLQG